MTKPQNVVLARARMPLYLFGLARSRGFRGRVGRCWVLSGFILVYRVLSGFIGFYRGLSGFIGFYRALVVGWLWWALVGFGDDELHNKPTHAVPLASARQHPELGGFCGF